MTTVRIVSDSACDIPAELCQKFNIRIIPAYIQFDLESIPDDGVSITPEQFYARLARTKQIPKTSAPPPGVAEKVIRAALEEADHVIAVHVSSKLSALLQTSRVAAQAIGGDRVSLFDTGSVSICAGWVALALAEAAAKGEDLKTLLELAESVRSRAKEWAAPSTLEYLRRSGRVNALMGTLGEALQIKPIISVHDWQVGAAAKVRTFKNAIAKLIEFAHSQAPLERLAVLHLNNPEGGKELRAALDSIAPPETLILSPSSAIGANFGPGGLGFSTLAKA